MQVYIALANSGWGYVFNGRKENEIMNIYLAGSYTRPYVYNEKKEDMNIYLAGAASGNNAAQHKDGRAVDLFYSCVKQVNKVYVLESFYYIKDWMIPFIKNHWNFLLDSGAFTFMANAKAGNGINWDEYIEKYAAFINENDIKLFFELDIDSVVGLKEVERLREKLERLTGKRSIPVWHKSRGLDYWKQMVRDYDYVAIGGIVTKEIKNHDIFIPLLKIAKEHNCKVHGLGFTQEKGMQKYKFHSVDSTAWIYGNRGGFLYSFNGKTLDKIMKPEKTRLASKEVAVHNFTEWVKFQRYAERNL
ncbi:MAG: hypothetical protein ACOYM1_11405 [Methylovulum sp.]